ncbi:hypothetical protein MKP07_29050 [Niabella hibiscisoli]|nr:hypothetical protein [Niabella hibiscisoli]MCH5719981.1 hypothetical protein [Niabella hibiscisoli]
MLTYIIQMITCSGILYGYYHFFLRNEKFHQYNRFYLLLAMLLSLVLPLIKISVYLTPDNSASSLIYAFAGTEENVTVAGTGSNAYLDWVWLVYLIPLLLLLARFALSIRHIALIRKASVVEPFDTVKLVNTDHTDAPFSFLTGCSGTAAPIGNRLKAGISCNMSYTIFAANIAGTWFFLNWYWLCAGLIHSSTCTAKKSKHCRSSWPTGMLPLTAIRWFMLNCYYYEPWA